MPFLGSMTIKNFNWNLSASNKALPYYPFIKLLHIHWPLEGTKLGLTFFFLMLDCGRLPPALNFFHFGAG